MQWAPSDYKKKLKYSLKFGQYKNINFQYKISLSLQTYVEAKINPPLSVLSVILKFSGQKAFDETIFAPSFMLANLNFSYNIIRIIVYKVHLSFLYKPAFCTLPAVGIHIRVCLLI